MLRDPSDHSCKNRNKTENVLRRNSNGKDLGAASRCFHVKQHMAKSRKLYQEGPAVEKITNLHQTDR